MATNSGSSLKSVYPEEICNLPMFHWIKKDQAEAIVRKYCKKEGSYLLRPSSTIDERHFSITLSISSDATVRHLRVNIERQQDKNGTKFFYYITSSKQFPTFLDFLKHYYVHPIVCDQNIRVKLLRGLGCSSKNPTIPGRRSSEPDFVFSVGDSQDEHGYFVQRSSTPNLYNSVHFDSHPSAANLPLSPSTASKAGQVYHNQMVIRQRSLTDPKHRPPPVIPKSEDSNYVFEYSVVPENKNFFEDMYNHFKETEMCECGLRVADTSLPGGWTIHKSDDTNVFFQRGETDTSWEIPADVVVQLTDIQVNYIYSLCKQIGCEVPNSLKSRCKVNQASPQGSVKFTPSDSGSGSSQTQYQYDASCEGSQADPYYEIPSPLVVASSPLHPASQLFQSPHLPSVSEAPDSYKLGDAASGESCSSNSYPPGQQFSHSDIMSSGEGSFSTSLHQRFSFGSTPAVTIEAMSGPPSVAPRTKFK